MTDNGNLKIKKMTTYIEDDYQTAYAKARRELGPNLIIMEKKDIKVGGFLGIMSKNKVKVTYGVEEILNRNGKSVKSKTDNKDIMDLLQKMGFDNKKADKTVNDDGVKLEINGLYNPYQNQSGTKRNKNGNKMSDTFSQVLGN